MKTRTAAEVFLGRPSRYRAPTERRRRIAKLGVVALCGACVGGAGTWNYYSVMNESPAAARKTVVGDDQLAAKGAVVVLREEATQCIKALKSALSGPAAKDAELSLEHLRRELR